jgi:hypothetical protein
VLIARSFLISAFVAIVADTFVFITLMCDLSFLLTRVNFSGYH